MIGPPCAYGYHLVDDLGDLEGLNGSGVINIQDRG